MYAIIKISFVNKLLRDILNEGIVDENFSRFLQQEHWNIKYFIKLRSISAKLYF